MTSPLTSVDSTTKIDENVAIQSSAHIERDVEIGDDCVIMPNASTLKGTRLDRGNKAHHGAVLGSEPQDFHYTGREDQLITSDNNNIHENVVISRATHEGGCTHIGDNNYLVDGVHLYHDIQISNHCILGIKDTVADDCRIDGCTTLSSSVTLHQNCHIGSWVLIQTGCRITKNVSPYIIVNGSPAEYHDINTMVLRREHRTTDHILRHIVNAYRLIYQRNFGVQDTPQKTEDQIPMSNEIHNIINFIRNSKGIAKQFLVRVVYLHTPNSPQSLRRVRVIASPTETKVLFL